MTPGATRAPMAATPTDLAVVAALCSLRSQRIEQPLDSRAAALARFREKKRRRVLNAGSAIRYQVRKTLAEQRPRERGRFTKRSPPPAPPPSMSSSSSATSPMSSAPTSSTPSSASDRR
eukprot:IDg14276t1